MVLRLIIQTILWIAVMAALLFLPAGTVEWPAAWVFLVETGGLGLAVGLWLARHDPALLAERLAPPVQREQKTWDKIFMAAILLLWCSWLPLMALDAARYRWSPIGWPNIGVWAQAAGALAIFVSIYISYLTLRENSYAAPVVKLQRGRGHKVVMTGPYRYVRHPMYAGAIFFFLGTPLLLGSRYGLVLAPLLIVLLAVRALMEERMLMAELDGYAAYARRVRYRLIPLIW
jgi:protein-S-isoprenylcysteine O-methyltransferase Ste14